MLFLAHLATGYKRSDDAEDIDEDYDYNDGQGRSLRQYFVEINCCMERNYDELSEGFQFSGPHKLLKVTKKPFNTPQQP